MKETSESRMIDELFGMIDELKTEKQREFITNLKKNIDPYSPWEDQIEGDWKHQLDWLYVIYDYYCNENEDAFEDWGE